MAQLRGMCFMKLSIAWKQATFSGFSNKSFKAFWRSACTVKVGTSFAHHLNELHVNRWRTHGVAKMNVAEEASWHFIDVGGRSARTV